VRWFVALSIACHPARPPEPEARPPLDPADAAVATTEPSTSPPPAPVGTPGVSPDAACARFATLADAGCDWTQRFPPQFRDPGVCERSLATWVSPDTPEHDTLQRTIDCWAKDCDEAAACMVQIAAAAPPPGPRKCGEQGTGVIAVDAATWARRRGAGITHFADIETSVSQPVEVCNIDGEVEWMTKVKCNDGSNPYGTPEVANESRDSWLGRGGRCNSILDRYSVRCHEATYTVYVDRYVCPQP
jgi:hypothetical protein